MSRDPVAITGLGAVSGFGVGVAPLWRALLAGETAIRPFDRFDAAPYRTKLASTVAADATDHGAASGFGISSG